MGSAAVVLGLGVVLGSMSAGCSGSVPHSPGPHASAEADEAGAAESATASVDGCDPRAMRACFADPVLIAGLATIGDKGVDGWKAQYEGGPAIEAELSRPHFAMADAAGSVYIADKDAHAIRKVTPQGVITTVAASPEVRSPNGLWVTPDGVVYVLDLGNSAIDRLDPEGGWTTLFEVPGGISIGRGLWVREDEALAYVASSSQVLRWTPSAGVEVFATGFSSLGNLVVDPDGALVVTDRAGGQVHRVDADGTRTTIAGSGKGTGGGDGAPALETSLPGVRAVWFDRNGGYFLGTHESSTVWFVDPQGTIHRFWGEPDLSEIRGLSEDHAGNLLIVDDDRGRVWRLERKL